MLETLTVNDIVTFTRMNVDEDERIALAASKGPWKVNNTNYPEDISDADGAYVVSGGRWGGEASIFSDDADAFHMVRHDPARVLREVAAKRRILSIHSIDPEKIVTYNEFDADYKWVGYTYPCQGCGIDGMGVDYLVTDIEECPELRALASVYADHEGYQKEWADDGTV